MAFYEKILLSKQRFSVTSDGVDSVHRPISPISPPISPPMTPPPPYSPMPPTFIPIHPPQNLSRVVVRMPQPQQPPRRRISSKNNFVNDYNNGIKNDFKYHKYPQNQQNQQYSHKRRQQNHHRQRQQYHQKRGNEFNQVFIPVQVCTPPNGNNVNQKVQQILIPISTSPRHGVVHGGNHHGQFIHIPPPPRYSPGLPPPNQFHLVKLVKNPVMNC
ncbi:4689_t:CDS:2 [Dentiscutata erythropus]|uniref:4689_t:CDS:1 n=1 Tax=Dentiscutata erythropus TaxID=1348616 RepID=A0A9N9GFA0_9GLOM|nr:4689_t:CDS:2 [Dentiscutata erythropus]